MKINKNEPVPFDYLADPDFERCAKHGTRHSEGMKLSILAAGIDRFRKFIQQCRPELAARESRRQLFRVYAGDICAQLFRYHLPGQLTGWDFPERKER